MLQLEGKPNKRKRVIGRISIVFFIVLLFLTFFSKTIDTFLLPQVTVGNPTSGSLQWKYELTGKLEFVDTVKVYSKGSWTIKEIPVEENQTVKAGDVLAIVDYGDLAMNVKQYELDILRLENDLTEYKNNFWLSSSYGSDDLRIEMKRQELDILRLENDFIEFKNSFWQTSVHEAYELELYNRRAKEYTLDLEIRKMELEKLKSGADADSGMVTASNSEDIPLAAGKEADEMALYKSRVEEMTLSLDIKKREFELFKSSLPVDGKILAETSGTVLNLNILKNARTTSGQVLCELVPADTAYRVTWTVQEEAAKYFEPGDNVMISFYGKEEGEETGDFNVSSGYKRISRTVAITGKAYGTDSAAYSYWADFEMEAIKVEHNQQTEVLCAKSSAVYALLVPRSALFEAEDNTSVFILQQQDGLFGGELVVRELQVSVLDSDDYYYAVDENFRTRDQIVLDTTKPLVNNARVKQR